MSTRSGRSYKERGSVQPEKMSEERIEGMLLEDWKSREAQFEEERQRQQRVVEEEKVLMREQMEMLTRFIGESRQVEETRTNVSQGSKEGEAEIDRHRVVPDYVRENNAGVRGEGEPVGGKAGSATDRQGSAGLHCHEGRGCWNISVVEGGHPTSLRYFR